MGDKNGNRFQTSGELWNLIGWTFSLYMTESEGQLKMMNVEVLKWKSDLSKCKCFWSAAVKG